MKLCISFLRAQMLYGKPFSYFTTKTYVETVLLNTHNMLKRMG